MNKKMIRLTESDLHKIVKESVNRILKEIEEAKISQDDMQEPYDGAKRFVPMSKKAEWARTTRNNLKFANALKQREQPNFSGKDAGYREKKWNQQQSNWPDYSNNIRQQINNVYNGQTQI